MARKRKKATRRKAESVKPSSGNGSSSDEQSLDADHVRFVSISEETRRRYLNYALSVITSRALPDVRDGLKPVQRRILYVMYQLLRLTNDSKTRKCAKIASDATGNFHPHGDAAVYDALVRLGQDFTYRYPLIHKQGNFGSILGLKAAASRYTEAKLSSLAEQLMSELRYETVDMRPNYDATQEEPSVLPSRYPNLLVNGTQGIAVGMATNIPPHNLSEVINASIHLIENPQATVAQLMKFVKGPDFPVGGRVVTDRTELRQAYENGRGAVKVRGEWKYDRNYKGRIDTQLVIHSVPYGVSTGPLLSDIGDLIESRKIPQLVAVNDETSEESGLRIVLEIKPDADPDAVMAYLFRHTRLEDNFSFNTTCLVPDEHGVMVPAVVSLKEMLQHFLDFRFETVRRRLEYQLAQLERRIHILKGFMTVFNGLDKALKIIRNSDGKKDAAEKLMKAFPLDDVQTDAVLELALYRISQLEISHIRAELRDKRKQARELKAILDSERRMWTLIKRELKELEKEFGDKRRTTIGSSDEITEFDAAAYIVKENTNVVITRDGWFKRVGRNAKLETTRVREGDEVMAVVPGSTLDNIIVFGSEGVAWTIPIDQVPATTGYGDPISKYVRTADGSQVVAALSTDERFTDPDKNRRGKPTPSPYLLIATANGQVMQMSLSTFRTPSTKVGRKYCRLGKGDRVVYVELVGEAKTMFLASKQARVLHFKINEVPLLASAGKGVKGLKLESKDEVLGAVQLSRPSDCLRVKNSNGKVLSFGQMKYGVTSRGGKGVKTSQRNKFAELIRPEIELVDWAEFEE